MTERVENTQTPLEDYTSNIYFRELKQAKLTYMARYWVRTLLSIEQDEVLLNHMEGGALKFRKWDNYLYTTIMLYLIIFGIVSYLGTTDVSFLGFEIDGIELLPEPYFTFVFLLPWPLFYLLKAFIVQIDYYKMKKLNFAIKAFRYYTNKQEEELKCKTAEFNNYFLNQLGYERTKEIVANLQTAVINEDKAWITQGDYEALLLAANVELGKYERKIVEKVVSNRLQIDKDKLTEIINKVSIEAYPPIEKG